MNRTYTDKVFELAKISKQVIAVPFALSFRYCNNNCKFCYLQPNMRKIPLPLDDCKKLSRNCIYWFNENASRFEPDMSLLVELIGGELFVMGVDYYQMYYETILHMYHIAKDHNIPFTVSLISNLLLDETHLELFIGLYNNIKALGVEVEIVSSYDLWDRFKTESRLLLWKNNLEKVQIAIKQNIAIETILSKPNIEKYITEPDTLESQTLGYLLKNSDKYNVIFNDYVPNKHENIQYVPNNKLVIEFYKKLIDIYGTTISALSFLDKYDLDKSDYKPCAYKEECCGPAFGLPSVTDYDTKLDMEEYGIYKLYCAEIGLVAPWGKSENVIKRSDLYKVDIPEDEWICVKQPERVKYYFDNILGCGHCPFKERCFKTKRMGCYITHQFKWKEDKCWIKEVFKYAKEKGIING